MGSIDRKYVAYNIQHTTYHMTPVVLDNIVFAIQRFGGISTVWGELLRRACADKELVMQVLDYPNDNMVRKELLVPSEQIIAMPYRRAERYRMPDWQPTTPTVFHSSYFRYCSHPLAKNITTVHDLTYHYYRHGLAKAVHVWEEQRALPKDLDYTAIAGLRLEARQKLSEIRPASLGQAARISGVNPSDISVLLLYLKMKGSN